MSTRTLLIVTMIGLLAALAARGIAAEDDAQQPREIKTDWGRIVYAPVAGLPNVGAIEVVSWPDDGVIELPTPASNITALLGRGTDPANWPILEFNKDASSIRAHLGKKPDDGPFVYPFQFAEHTVQMPEGTIILTALDAKVEGKTAKLESHPGNHRIGFWSDADDTVAWDYSATRWGMYEVWLTYSSAGADGTTFTVGAGDHNVAGALKSTGSWYRYRTIKVGKLYLAQAGRQTIAVKCTNLVGVAVMNLKAVTLMPASEGRAVVPQNPDGEIVLHARDATVRGVKLRWEPKPEKQTLGYWAEPRDRAEWTFDVAQPGKFKVEVLQGCGKGQGGSKVALFLARQSVEFIVEDTGHWQNFKPRIIGEIEIKQKGKTFLLVQPQKKKGVAVMDLRQVRLLPVKE